MRREDGRDGQVADPAEDKAEAGLPLVEVRDNGLCARLVRVLAEEPRRQVPEHNCVVCLLRK